MSPFENLSPQSVWKHFYHITQIPRPSKKEEKIVQYLINFAKEKGLAYEQDAIGNLVIRKGGSKGKENGPIVILQSHVDMVCEKNEDTEFNFDTDPIETYIEEGWVKAKGTTLGGDDGIGVATELAILEADNLVHGPIECLFTVDEETGLSGAFALEEGFLNGEILLNLDSEDWGELCIGCAGGVDSIATFHYIEEDAPKGYFPAEITISGLKGGHSGADIHLGLGNANKILNRFIYQQMQVTDLRLAEFDGGNLRNAIAREAKATLLVPAGFKENLRANLNIFASDLEDEFRWVEPELEIALSSCDIPQKVMNKEAQEKLIHAIYACPHGVVAMSKEIKGLTETSTNLASVKFKESGIVEVVTSQRSSIESAKDDIAAMVKSVFILAGASVRNTDGYPGWKPNKNSNILKLTELTFTELFSKEPIVNATHGGLECGLFLKKYPGLDMVSFGPTIYGAHSPDERMNIKTVEQFWNFLIALLKKI